MTDNDVTLPEVYRAIQALDTRCREAFDDFDRSQHSLRNRQQSTDVLVAVINSRLATVENTVKGLSERESAAGRDMTARYGAFGAAAAAAGSAIFAWFHK